MNRKRSFSDKGEEDPSERPQGNRLQMSTLGNEAEKQRREGKRTVIFLCLNSIMEWMVGSWSMMPEERPDIRNMSREQFDEYLNKSEAERNRLWEEHLDKNDKKRQKILEDLIAKEAPLIKMQEREAKRRERIVADYFRKNPLNKELFILDIARYSSIYVCSFGYAKLESSEYKMFIKSLTDDDSYKVYLGRKQSLSEIVGLVSEEKFNPKLKPEDAGYETKEMLPGLHNIGSMLFNYDDAGVILTDKTKEEVLRKFKEYGECDFVKAGQRPTESLVFEKDDCLTLPPHSRSNPSNLSVKLRKLGMPVKLSEDGKRVCVADTFRVCEVGKRVTEDAAEILKHLDKKMFKYVLLPLCCWSASTKETEYFDVDLPGCW
ncbi:hypothetical protein MKW92_050226 [Papaver armeniacum]|nr:hypothetical protein MKW92_050226 [Papaver armeniacum]